MKKLVVVVTVMLMVLGISGIAAAYDAEACNAANDFVYENKEYEDFYWCRTIDGVQYSVGSMDFEELWENYENNESLGSEELEIIAEGYINYLMKLDATEWFEDWYERALELVAKVTDERDYGDVDVNLTCLANDYHGYNIYKLVVTSDKELTDIGEGVYRVELIVGMDV